MELPTYPEIVSQVIQLGEDVPSRHGLTLEVPNGHVDYVPGVVVSRERLNLRIGWQEVCQFLGEFYNFSLFQAVAPKAQLALFTPQMAYGPRLQGQLVSAIKALRKDPASRQCFIFIGKPDDGQTSNLPCTIGMQFLVRENTVMSTTYMRSWDLIKGLPYDLMMFGAATQVVAHCLELPVTESAVEATSAHVYYSDKMLRIDPHYRMFRIRSNTPRDPESIRDILREEAFEMPHDAPSEWLPRIFEWVG